MSEYNKVFLGLVNRSLPTRVGLGSAWLGDGGVSHTLSSQVPA